MQRTMSIQASCSPFSSVVCHASHEKFRKCHPGMQGILQLQEKNDHEPTQTKHTIAGASKHDPGDDIDKPVTTAGHENESHVVTLLSLTTLKTMV